MGKIVYLMGKSSTGKDTIFKGLQRGVAPALKTIVPYTTRPIREGEKNGREYFFSDEETFQRLKQEDRIIEDRIYHTCHGPWRYFTVDDGQIELDSNNYIMIGTLEAYRNIREYFGRGKVLPIMIDLEDGERLQRALDREKRQQFPRFEEMCRRFLADSEDFSEEKLREAGITRRFYNDDLESCLLEIRKYIEDRIE